MRNFLGKKTMEQIEMIKAILKLEGKPFSAKKVAELSGLDSSKFGGGFMALANKCAEYPALILRSGREKTEKNNGKHVYVQIWKINPDFPLVELENMIKNF